MKTFVSAIVLILIADCVSLANERCKSNPYNHVHLLFELNKYIERIRADRGVDGEEARYKRFINDIIKHSRDLDCYHVGVTDRIINNISCLAIMLGTNKAIDTYLDFLLGMSYNASESLDVEFAKVFHLSGMKLLSRIAIRKKEKKLELLKMLSDGILILLYSYCTKYNYHEILKSYFCKVDSSKGMGRIVWEMAVKKLEVTILESASKTSDSK